MVHISPLPLFYRTIPERLWPGHPPVFDGPPTADDLDLARELWLALDEESQRWYSSLGRWLFKE